ncbi:MAG: hypothetical protein M3082_06290 [Candidatus Dormibacteraeota bacterium]|nr:hypothetical protein [Candidatus Dormibacteraeota bacterium]
MTAGRAELVAAGTSGAYRSSDEGKTWLAFQTPSGAIGLAVDAANKGHAIAGGSTVQVTGDGGAHWSQPPAAPPGQGPYTPLRINPGDAGVWFLSEQGRLLRTRDAGNSWRQLTGLPPLGEAVLVAGPSADQFFLATGSRLFELDDNGQQIIERTGPPGGASVVGLSSAPGLLLMLASNGKVYLSNGSGWSDLGMKAAGPIATAGSHLWVGAGGDGPGGGRGVTSSEDGGRTWFQGSGLPNRQTVEGIAPSQDGHRVVAYCSAGDIYTSGDAGRTWTFRSAGLRIPTHLLAAVERSEAVGV